MAEYKKQTIIASAVAFLIALSAGLGIYYLQPQLSGSSSATKSASSTITRNYDTTAIYTAATYTSQTAKATNSSFGLELFLSTNASTLLSGQAINVSLSIVNFLPRVNNVPRDSNWALAAFNNSLGCCSENYYSRGLYCPAWANFVIFSGFYEISNISSADAPLLFTEPQRAHNCLFTDFSSFLFLPSSGIANVTSSSPPEFSPLAMVAYNSVDGSYSASTNVTANGDLPPTPFHSGVYTIAAGDEWGQITILHFSVS